MKTLIPALLFSAAIPAVCQTTPQRPIPPNHVFKMPPQFAPAPRDTAKPKAFTFDGSAPMPQVLVLPRSPQSAGPRVGDPHLDEQIIHRPPLGAFAEQQPRTPSAGSLYPGLKLLLTETASLEPIPVYFPKLKVEPIPTTLPNAKMTPLKSAQQSAQPGPVLKK